MNFKGKAVPCSAPFRAALQPAAAAGSGVSHLETTRQQKDVGEGEDEGFWTSLVLPADSSEPAGFPGRVNQLFLLIRDTRHPWLGAGQQQQHQHPCPALPGSAGYQPRRAHPECPRSAIPNSGVFWEGIHGLEGSCARPAPGRSCGQPGTAEKVSPPRRQQGLRRCQSSGGTWGMGKGKLALDKALSATTAPMGARPGLLSQPLRSHRGVSAPC